MASEKDSKSPQSSSEGLGFLEDLKKQWMAMIDAVNDPLAIVDSNYTILRQNRAYSRASSQPNLAITDFQGRKCYEAFAGRASPCAGCRLSEAAHEGKTQEWQSVDSIKQGRTHIVRVHALDESQSVARYVVHYRDVTEFVALQEKLSHSDKLAALGKLAGGVAHEINSPLAGIMAFTQMMLKEIPDSDPHREDLMEIEEAARKCKVIVENLLGFSRQEKSKEVFTFNVLDTVESTLRLMRALFSRSHIKVHYSVPERRDDFVIEGWSGKISQVFLNLMTNAVQALESEGGGEIFIESERLTDHVVVRFQDSGPGMTPEVMKKIFDPFFTTKPVGQGTGLGLSISYAIVKSHGGRILVDSAPGEGTTFSIELPCRAAGSFLSEQSSSSKYGVSWGEATDSQVDFDSTTLAHKKDPSEAS